MKKLFAFNLAEVALVMGIIGIIGVLGVTNAKKDTDTAEKVAQLKKTYEILDAAVSQAVMDSGNVKKWTLSGDSVSKGEILWSYLTPYLKLTRNCGNTTSGCWKNDTLLKVDKTKYNKNIETNNNFYKGILANGVSIAIPKENSDFASGSNHNTFGGYLVIVDVNGKKGLSMLGNDVFTFAINRDDDIIHPAEQSSRTDAIKSSHDIYKGAWVIQFGNMDYLKACGNTLKWSGPHTCK